MTVRGVPMTDYMENLIKMTMASKAGQVIITYLLLLTVVSYVYLPCLISLHVICAVHELLNLYNCLSTNTCHFIQILISDSFLMLCATLLTD